MDPLFVGSMIFALVFLGALAGAYCGLVVFFMAEDARHDRRQITEEQAG